MGYRVRIVELAKEELKALPARSSARILYEVEAQLVAQPGVETRNRKRVDVVPSFEHVPPVWELRVGEFRVFYGIDESEREVRVWAVRRKGRKTTGEIV